MTVVGKYHLLPKCLKSMEIASVDKWGEWLHWHLRASEVPSEASLLFFALPLPSRNHLIPFSTSTRILTRLVKAEMSHYLKHSTFQNSHVPFVPASLQKFLVLHCNSAVLVLPLPFSPFNPEIFCWFYFRNRNGGRECLLLLALCLAKQIAALLTLKNRVSMNF